MAGGIANASIALMPAMRTRRIRQSPSGSDAGVSDDIDKENGGA
jgi:hypothetical protein